MAQAASEVKCKNADGDDEPCPKPENEDELALQENADQKTQLAASLGDGTLGNDFSGLSHVGVIVVSVVAGLIILFLLAGLLYCFRRKKGKTMHGKGVEMKTGDGPPTPKMRKHNEFKND